MIRSYQIIEDKKLGKLFFPEMDNVMAPTIASEGLWEPNEIAWLEMNVAPGDRCLNVGANIGYFTIIMSELAGKTGFVYSIEPNSDVIPFFTLNIQNRKLTNIKLFQFAAGDSREKTFLYKNRKNYGDGRMFDPRITTGGGDWKSFGFDQIPIKKKVKMRRISDLRLGRIDVVLLDAQGYDHFALRGMQLNRTRHLPKILTEFVPDWISDLGDDPIEVLKEYKSWGFKVESIDFPELNALSERKFIAGIKDYGTFFTNLSLTPVGTNETSN